ncbi:hypothetical protein SAMN02910436_02184 [Ruminococcaceae bacterium P7]|nr:hypothetical protein SAMN02910436_02184 [Ruminococcaceae bacterium P7]
MKKFFREYFSVPVVIYLVIFLVCAFLLIPKVSGRGDKGTEILANISYSLLASNIAGILFDFGNNITNEKKMNKQYRSITNSHSQLLNDIIIIIDDVCTKLNIDNDLLSFDQQLAAVLLYGDRKDDINSETYLDSTEDILHWLNLLKNGSEKIIILSYIQNNSNFNEAQRLRLRLLSSLADETIQQFSKHTLESHKTTYTLINDRIMRILLKQYPDQKSLFE